MITAPEDRGWWIAADGKWYPPETHPDADPAPASDEPGWWLASDGLWYPPETHPDAQGAPPLEAPSSDGTSAEWTEMLATFAAFETRPRGTESVASPPTPRRRRGLIAVSLVATLAVAAKCDRIRRDDRAERTEQAGRHRVDKPLSPRGRDAGGR